MHKNNRMLIFLFSFFLFASCNAQKQSSLELQYGELLIPLTALNKNAVTSSITNPQKSPYAYYAFPTDFDVPQNRSLQIHAEFSKPEQKKENSPLFAFGFLFNDDFNENGILKNELVSRALIYGFDEGAFDISMQIPQKIRGFFVNAAVITNIKRVKITAVEFGYNLGGEFAWFGFSSEGGKISLTNPENAAQFTKSMVDFFGKTNAQITVNLLPPLLEKSEKTVILVGKSNIRISSSAPQKQVFLHTAQFLENDFKVVIKSNNTMISGIILEKAQLDSPISPISADPGLILTWAQKNWRNPDFEVFSWQQFPNVLFFDTANYAVLNDFFKRLAFFVEKKGYKGTLAKDSEIADKHAFNAHDYRAEDLARFFETVRIQNFPLNKKEQLLFQILLENGIVKTEQGSITAGSGALVAVSRESAEYLRYTFVPHEAFHALYFTDADFRNMVSTVYKQTNPKAIRFLLRYFAVTSTLNYDINDTYLIHNEFMGYIMQQSVSRTADYFVKSIATRPGIMQAEPLLVEYITQTNAQDFVEAAAFLDNYVFKRWGYNAGRIHLVTKD